MQCKHTASPSDKNYTKQKQAGAIAEKVLVQVSDHPGAHHYVIHAYDYPPLATKALNEAQSYGKIAPDIHHASYANPYFYAGWFVAGINHNEQKIRCGFPETSGRQ